MSIVVFNFEYSLCHTYFFFPAIQASKLLSVWSEIDDNVTPLCHVCPGNMKCELEPGNYARTQTNTFISKRAQYRPREKKSHSGPLYLFVRQSLAHGRKVIETERKYLNVKQLHIICINENHCQQTLCLVLVLYCKIYGSKQKKTKRKIKHNGNRSGHHFIKSAAAAAGAHSAQN